VIADAHTQLDDFKKRGTLLWRVGFGVFDLLE
jgi:hypothetical protein